ncbi:hypothetical protein FE391_04480 [Nonomuraea sp. KC401]|uniref:Uncharacterized protein n=1 Tax=Nonomuraea longispora TaxID=1848320 RepID=A0A4V2XKF5_9ACTN|nr:MULTISPECIES: hypothetical protein [Nonomuraea]NBE92927.1 hypothetical protein [Nonomuraea sp. K271]TDC05976.1 hypothetical protein E1267_17860 [Nonomuraea longispora]TLF83340.1 hypothetical protein FE391_04480 [Nonomuraea sp. KC401]
MIGRHSLELALPGASIGAAAGAMAGGLTLLAGQPTGMAALSALALSVPLGLFGGLYGVLLGHGVFRPGTFGPVGLFWMVAFPVSRLVQESLAGVGMADGVLPFLAYQAMVALGFAIGFVWLHERLMPHWLMRRAGANPEAKALLGQYIKHAQALQATRKGSRR